MDDAMGRLRAERALVADFEAARPVAPGSLTPRGRIEALVDDGTFLELGSLTRSQQPEVADHTPGDGIVAGWGKVGGREVALLGEDPLVLGRTDAQVAENKRLRILNTSAAKATPVVLFVDGPAEPAPPFAPTSGELFGYMARQWPEPSSGQLRAPTVAIVLGPARGRSAELVAASDLVVLRRGEALAPDLADVVAPDDADAIETVRRFLAVVPASTDGPLERRAPRAPSAPLADALPPHPTAGSVLEGVLDDGATVGFRSEAALRTGVGSVAGYPVAFAATGEGRPVVIGRDELVAIARLVRLARRLRIPLLFVQDTLGYDPAESSDGGFLRLQRDVIDDVRSNTAPKFCVVTGRGHVLGTFVLGGRQLGIDFVGALPTARVVPLDVPSYEPGAVPEDGEEGPWLAAGLGHVDEVLAPSELRDHLAGLLAVMAPGRGLPTVEEERGGRYIDDIPKV